MAPSYTDNIISFSQVPYPQ